MTRSLVVLLARVVSTLIWLGAFPVLAGGAGAPTALVAPSTQGCDVGFQQLSPAALLANLQAARRRWRAAGLPAYHFTLNVFNVPEGLTRTDITVNAQGHLRAVPHDGQPASRLALSASVPGLFSSIQASLSLVQRTACLDVAATYATDGHPQGLSVSLRRPGIRDGEAFWTVTNFIRR